MADRPRDEKGRFVRQPEKTWFENHLRATYSGPSESPWDGGSDVRVRQESRSLTTSPELTETRHAERARARRRSVPETLMIIATLVLVAIGEAISKANHSDPIPVVVAAVLGITLCVRSSSSH